MLIYDAVLCQVKHTNLVLKIAYKIGVIQYTYIDAQRAEQPSCHYVGPELTHVCFAYLSLTASGWCPYSMSQVATLWCNKCII